MTAADTIELIIGTYTNTDIPNGTDGPDTVRGIVRASVTADGSRIEAHNVTPIAPLVNPTWVQLSADGRYVYAACETEDGAVLALSLDDAGKLSALNSQPTGGSDPCHVTLVNGGTHLVAADYGSGTVSAHPVNADGTLGERTGFVQHAGSGPNTDRQAAAHAHMIAEDPSGRFILAIDLGTDSVYAYALDTETGSLTEAARTTLEPGFGPRHLAFHPNGDLVYIVGELGLDIAVCEYDASTGRLNQVTTIPSVENGEIGADYPSGIRVTPDGRFLHAAIRGKDVLSTFSLADPRGPAPVCAVPTGGTWPRDIAVSPDGTLLFCSNQLSDDVTVFALDAETGVPTPTGATLAVPAPSCVVMR